MRDSTAQHAFVVAVELRAVRDLLRTAIGSDDWDAVQAAEAAVCRAGFVADAISAAVGGTVVVGCAEDWMMTGPQLGALAALRHEGRGGNTKGGAA